MKMPRVRIENQISTLSMVKIARKLCPYSVIDSDFIDNLKYSNRNNPKVSSKILKNSRKYTQRHSPTPIIITH